MGNQEKNHLEIRTHFGVGFTTAPRECGPVEWKYPCCLARWNGSNLQLHPKYSMKMTGAECNLSTSPFQRVSTGYNCYEC